MSEQPVKCKLDIGDGCLNLDEHVGCNPTCTHYNPVDESVSTELEELIEEEVKKTKNQKDINLKLSGMEKFNKTHEFVVLKKHVFEFQSISPKKIILKYKRKLNKTDKIADGCYVFTDKNDELLIPHQVFLKFDREAKDRQNAREKLASIEAEKNEKVTDEMGANI